MSKPHSAHLLGFFIAPLIYNTIVTVMTVVKAITIRCRSGGPSSQLIQTFLRKGVEGVFYYLIISIANLINGIFYLQYVSSTASLVWNMQEVLCSSVIEFISTCIQLF
ncbi:hypothetical protein BC835DRAFT_1422112 [Cytidiella melzeri]|nr:hypothetical protein BC835DRAFT_1422112 [Cytidiella melzeri]